MPTVALVTEDPLPDAGTPGASFTRFVLPFIYSPTRLVESTAPRGRYEPHHPVREDERRRYLTPETADVLFNRALWLQLDHADFIADHEYSVKPHAGQGSAARLRVRHAPPRLVLFEWARHASAIHADDDGPTGADLLNTGFLIQDVTLLSDGDTQPTLAQLQALNDYFRFWQRPFKGYGAKGHAPFFGRNPDDDGHEHYFAPWADRLDFPFRAPTDGKLWQLFPAHWRSAACAYVQHGHNHKTDAACSGWIAYPDPRAFVWTCAVAPGGAQSLANAPLTVDALPADWVRLLNVDPPATSDASTFERDWARDRTYGRWMHYGSLYGFCSHAGALLAPPLDDPPVHHHFAELYFDQTLLLLYLRVSTFRFSRALSEMSGRALDSGARARDELAEHFQELRRSFALLTNLYRFPLLSHQQQGIELYSRARKQLDIEELFTEIQSEVHATDEFLSGATQVEHARMATLLTVVATIALAAALGLDFLQVQTTGWPTRPDWPRIVTAGAAAFVFLLLLALVLLFSDQLARYLKCIASTLRRTRAHVDRHASRGRHDR